MLEVDVLNEPPQIELVPFIREDSNTLSVEIDLVDLDDSLIEMEDILSENTVSFNAPSLILDFNVEGELISIESLVPVESWDRKRILPLKDVVNSRCKFCIGSSEEFEVDLEIAIDDESGVVELNLVDDGFTDCVKIADEVVLLLKQKTLVGFHLLMSQ